MSSKKKYWVTLSFALACVLAGAVFIAMYVVSSEKVPSSWEKDGDNYSIPAASQGATAHPHQVGPGSIDRGQGEDKGNGKANDRGIVGAYGGIEIPALEAESSVDSMLNMDEDGDYLPPHNGVGMWGKGSTLSSTEGNTLLSSHVWYHGNRGVFWNLNNIQLGNVVTTYDQNGNRTDWLVDSIKETPKNKLPRTVFDGRKGPRKLTLVTCTGKTNGHHWTKSLIVTAQLKK